MNYQDMTALVTGASSGIGRAFAEELASRGSNIVLVALELPNLQKTASEIERIYGVKTLTLAVDLSQEPAPQAIFESISKAGWSVDVLVNAAGFGTRGQAHSLDATLEQAEFMVNAHAVMRLTYLALPAMVARSRGVIINVGSSSGSFWPAPFMAMYGATKAFVLSFTEALWGEYHTQGLRITALCPAPTDTGFHKAVGFAAQHTVSPAVNKKKRTPQQAVQAAFKALDEDRPYVVDGGMLVRLRAFLPRLLTARSAVALAARELRVRPTDDHLSR